MFKNFFQLFMIRFYILKDVALACEPVIDKSKFCCKIVSDFGDVERLLNEGYDLGDSSKLVFIENNLKKSFLMFIIFEGYNWRHISWVALDNKIAFDGFFRGKQYSGYAVVGPCLTHEAARGIGLYPYVLAAIYRRATLVENLKGLLISTGFTNRSSMRGIEKSGFCVLGFGILAKFYRFSYYIPVKILMRL